MKRIIIDLDETICTTNNHGYEFSTPRFDVIQRLRDFRELGFEIVINTSRNMRTYNGNIGKINVHTLPIILQWLNNNKVPFDEIYTGKPWCGTEGFYVDDRSIRPDEFVRLSVDAIQKLVSVRDE